MRILQDLEVVGCDLNVDAAQASVDMVLAAGRAMVSLQPCQLTEPSHRQSTSSARRHGLRTPAQASMNDHN